MIRQKACFRFVFLVIAVSLLASVIGLVACAEPPTPAPAPAPTPAPAPAPTLAPTPAPDPSPQPEKNKEATAVPSREQVFVHFFWGHVETDTGKPAANVEVTAWINGELSDSITTDSSGKYGKDLLVEFPSYLTVNGQVGDIIEFRVDGVTAQEIRLGVLPDDAYEWQWQDLDPGWQAALVADEVNGIDLSYKQRGGD